MSVYLDANVLVALFTADIFTQRASRRLLSEPDILIVSDFAAAEFSSALARLVRMNEIERGHAHAAFGDFDVWTTRMTTRVDLEPNDIRIAQSFLRRLDLNLRTPDALHIAAALRLDSKLLTFDDKMAACAKTIGCKVAVA